MTEPLWWVMHRAFDYSSAPPGCEWDDHHGYAAELSVIADEIAKRDPDNSMSALAVEEWLRAEADRADAGE